ncbi:MAG: LamG domain-containing protein, partial [Rhodothermaceae bacterium]|nr:LamG domain-containing protein [Rhodothermaceae bacterium]
LLATPGEGATWESATLFDDVELETDSKRFLVRDTSMQFQWTREQPQSESSEPSTDAADLESLQLLPGMFLRPGDAPGFTALTFHSEPGSNGIPNLILDTAFIEALLHCQWSRFLQESVSAVEVTPEGDPIYDSSAGDLFFGYTAEWKGEAGWEEVLLLNGFLEVKNLVSWPTAIQLDEGKTNLTLPSFQDKTTLDHYRHSIRILFNQHQVPVNLTVVGSGNLLFQFNQAFSWQFLAVVEHQIVEITEDSRLGLERRWTTVQEIRLASPSVFKTFLNEFDQANTVLPDSGTGSVGNHSYGYLSSGIRSRLAEGADAELDKMAQNSFIVEASAPHWINLKSIRGASETTLQFLPNGTQVGILSQPDYYSPSDPRDPQWLLLSLPFIGRLQNESAADVTGSDTPLHVDPIKYLLSDSSDKSLALNFASWGEDEAITIAVSGFDTSAGRTWARLDPNTLRESWFRIQHPQQEAQADGLRSVMASLPDTPARMSRSVALRQLFDTNRASFPPTEVPADEDGELSDSPTLVSPSEPLEWRPDSWFAPQEISTITTEDNPDGLLALYTFEEGEGIVVRDRSGSANPLDLRMQKRVGSNWEDLDETDTHVQWLEGGGLEVVNPMILRSLTPAAAISLACTASGEITIEAWIRPANIEQGINDQARIVSIADSTSDRNITMGYKRQGTSSTAEYDCSYRLAVGTQLQFRRIVPTGSAVVEDRIHVAYVHKQTGESIMYFDGQEITRRSDEGTFANWMEDFPLVLANELNGSDVPWRGVYFLVAIYGVALEPEEILAHVQAGTIKGRSSTNGYKWYNPGLHLLDSNLIRTRNELSEPLSHLISHHAAATALPASLQRGDNPSPVSVAVSPYLGLGFKAAIDEYNPLLVSAELLCLDQVSGVLSPVASRFLNAGENSDTGSAQEESIKWGKETHQKLCPESPFAILRFREINERDSNADTAINQASVTATYSYAILTNLAEPERFARRVFPLRSTVKELRFREGQFGGYHPPSPGVSIDQVEIAPPQTVGVQPLYIKGLWRIFDASDRTRYTVLIAGDQAALYELEEDEDSSAETLILEETLTDKTELKALITALQRGNGILDSILSSAFPATFPPPSPDDEDDSSEEVEAVTSSDTSVHRAWPWGLSALRLEIAYTEDGKGVIGTLDPSETDTERTLWWQSHSYQVQFRSALADQPVAGLPPYFRAPAIKGLLPVLPDPPMPTISVSSADTFNSEAALSERWQAILPGVLRFMITGDRPGVPFAFRSHIITQRGFSQTGASTGQTLVSGGTPVQHKMPRPTPLPLTGRRDVALQTWSSFFAPEKLLLAKTRPVDEAFFSRCEAFDALAYQVRLSNPAPGSWTSEWNTELVLDIQIHIQKGNWPLFRQYFLDKALDTVQPGDEPEDPDATIASLLPELIHEWVSVEITDGDQSFTYTHTGQPDGTEYTFRISENDQSAFDTLLGSLVPGSEIHVLTHIGNERFTASYRQSLSFPMRRVDEDKFRLPLKPFYIHFEDPEYNRRLTSAATQATRNIKTLVGDDQDRELTTVTLATDRKEYNPNSLLSVRYDWETNYDGSGHLKIEKIEASSGNPIRLFSEEMRNLSEDDQVFNLAPKTLLQIPLNKLEQNTGPAALSGGTTLQLTLTLTAIDEGPDIVLEGEQIIVLNVDIVDQNVIPKPEAAYALLRSLDDTASKVECARFAWGPESNRIDLLCPDDLRTGIVRRRAVFNWSDVVRYTQFKGYCIQKITQSGSTHFPSDEDFIID